MIETLITAIAGVLVGVVTTLSGVRLGMRKQAQKGPRPICTCKHGRGMHSQDKGCMAKVGEHSQYKAGRFDRTDVVLCACASYDGPKPFEELYPHPVLPPSRDL